MGFDVLLSEAKTQLFTLVCAHSQDAAFSSKEGKSLMNMIFESAVPLPKANLDLPPVELPNKFWKQHKDHPNAEFKDNGWDYWSFDSLQNAKAKDHPLGGLPAAGSLYLLFYKPL